MPNIFDPNYEERDGPPGETAYPYHFHYSDEELLFVLSGWPTRRTPAPPE